MATGDYVTLPELKRELWPDDEVPDGTNDTALASVITAVSREIDQYTGTSFYDPGSDDTRYYTADDGNTCWIDPATTITSVATDDEVDRTWGTSWTLNTHYETWPYNANSFRGVPTVRLDRVPLGDYVFPSTRKAVKVVGRFCYDAAADASETLDDINRICLLKCVRLFKRKDSPFGVMSVGELGNVTVVPGFDPDAQRILDNYRVNPYG